MSRFVYTDTVDVGDLIRVGEGDDSAVYHVHDIFFGDVEVVEWDDSSGGVKRFLVVQEGSGNVGEIDLRESQIVEVLGSHNFFLQGNQ